VLARCRTNHNRKGKSLGGLAMACRSDSDHVLWTSVGGDRLGGTGLALYGVLISPAGGYRRDTCVGVHGLESVYLLWAVQVNILADNGMFRSGIDDHVMSNKLLYDGYHLLARTYAIVQTGAS
jgi:hypothetical protein